MQAILMRIFLILSIIVLLNPNLSLAATEQRTALVIGNGGYSSSPLKNPVNDAIDIAANLQKLGFAVTLKKNASHQQMEDAILEFGEQLKKGGVGLFFYAGHGVQIAGRNYLLPIGVKVNKEADVKFQAVDAEMVLAEMNNAGNDLNILILDACRDNPFIRKFRSTSRGLAIISEAPKGTLITYSTSPGNVAEDGNDRNSPYTEALIRHMNSPGLPIEEVFKRVRRDISKKTKGQQVPWEMSSLEGQFYFSPASPVETSPPIQQALYKKDTDTVNAFKKKKDLIIRSEPKTDLAEGELSSFILRYDIYDSKYNKFGNFKNVFSDKGDGTIIDNTTGLMWQKGGSTYTYEWPQINTYLRDLNNKQFAGDSDWRLPTIEELLTLFNKKIKGRKLFIDASFSDKQYACWSADWEKDAMQGISNQWGVDAWIWYASFELGSAMIAATSKSFSPPNSNASAVRPREFFIKAVRTVSN